MASGGDKEKSARVVKRLANALDSRFSLGPMRIGWDAILGLIPGIGDSLGAIAASYIVYEASRLGMPKSVIIRMVFNILIDTLIGSIPFIGDFSDIFWKSNQKNANLFENALASSKRLGTSSLVWLIALGLIMAVLIFLALFIPLKILAFLLTQ